MGNLDTNTVVTLQEFLDNLKVGIRLAVFTMVAEDIPIKEYFITVFPKNAQPRRLVIHGNQLSQSDYEKMDFQSVKKGEKITIDNILAVDENNIIYTSSGIKLEIR